MYSKGKIADTEMQITRVSQENERKQSALKSENKEVKRIYDEYKALKTEMNIFSAIPDDKALKTRKQFTFIEFNTTKDINDAYKYLKRIEQDYKGLHVSYARSEQKFDPTNQFIPLEDVIPLSHRFWLKLQKMIFNH